MFLRSLLQGGRSWSFLTRLSAVVLLFLAVHGSFLPGAIQAQGNVGIGTTTPDASALLDLTSTTKGLLVPRVTHAQMSLIPSPATGLLVYCTDSTGALLPATYYYYTGSAWIPLMGNYIANYLQSYGVIYGPASQQATLAAGATPLFNVAYRPASGSVSEAGAEIEADASAATTGSATGLTVIAKGSGSGTTATGLSVSATGAAQDTAINATGMISENGNAIANTSTDGLLLQNLSGASSGITQQYSPRIDLTGSAYNSASGSSETDKFILENRPQSTAGTTSENLTFSSIVNGGSQTKLATLSSDATLTLGVAGTTTGSLALGNASGSNNTTLQSGASAPAVTYVLPTTQPATGQVLNASSVSGSGPYTANLQWTNISAISGSGAAVLGENDTDIYTTSTTLSNVTGLGFSVGANETWSFQFWMMDTTTLSTSVKEGIVFALTWPTGATVYACANGTVDNGANGHEHPERIITSGVATSQIFDQSQQNTVSPLGVMMITGIIKTGSTSGTVQVQFANSNTGYTSRIFKYGNFYAFKH